jgi:hypothetical protein
VRRGFACATLVSASSSLSCEEVDDLQTGDPGSQIQEHSPTQPINCPFATSSISEQGLNVPRNS